MATSAFDKLIAGEDRKTCRCGKTATCRLLVQLREIDDTGKFFKGGKSIQRGINLCAECGVERWERYRQAALGEVGHGD